jgi:hypothetical protein
VSCAEDKKPPFNLPENAQSLITGDASKTWKLARRTNNNIRMNMGDCFLSYRATYKTDSTMHDNNGLFRDCGETLTANWLFYNSEEGYPYIKLKGEQLKKVMNLDVDYKFFKILDLSESQLVLEFSHEQFSSKETTIIDVFVPEDVIINDRDFHW